MRAMWTLLSTVVEPESGADLIGAAEAMTTLRDALGEAALAAAVQRGRNLTLTAAVTRAIEI